VQAIVDSTNFANNYVSSLTFSATDLVEFSFAVGSGIAAVQTEVLPEDINYPALIFTTTYYTYAIFSDEGNSDVFARFDISRRTSAVPEPSAMLLLLTGLIGLVGIKKKFKA